MQIPAVDLNLKVVWNYLFKYDVEYDWQAEWTYGWDDTDLSMFGPIGYTEPHAFEVRRYFTGSTQYGTHRSPYKHTISGNSTLPTRSISRRNSSPVTKRAST